MMSSWLNFFQNDDGPTLYSYSNRTPVTGDVNLITTFVLFATVFLAFLIIFPGIRKERWTTFLTVTLVLFVGMTIQVTQSGSSWHTSTSIINSSDGAFSSERISAELGGYVGLMHINITYKGLLENTDKRDIDYNERFYWRAPQEMKECLKDALHKGTPFPIISLAEYFSLNQEGFSWGGRYREAGYYTSAVLWTAFASWCMTNLLLVMVPRYGAYGMVFTGVFMLSSNFMYWWLLPCEPLIAHIDGAILMFSFGWNYWLVFVAGIACAVTGCVIIAIDMIIPHSFSTILEVDYDTPYDRHVIIEESFDTRHRDLHADAASLKPSVIFNPKASNKTETAFAAHFVSQEPLKLLNDHSDDGLQGLVNSGFIIHPLNMYTLQDKVSNGDSWSYPFPSIRISQAV